MNANLKNGLCLLLLRILSLQVKAQVIINEVAYKGSPDQCDGEDWVEIFNDGPVEINLFNYVLHDDKGKDDEDAKILPEILVAPGEFLLLCNSVDFDFGIGTIDVVTLLDSNGQLISEVALPGEGEDTSTYAYFDGEYKYTTTPTPGSSNTFTAEETLEEQLEKQNALGNEFFLSDETVGEPSVFGKVVVIDVIMDTINLEEIQDHPAYSNYVPFNQFSVRTADYTADYVVSAGTGEIRTKGASTLTKVACYGLQNVPFSVKFDTPFLGMEEVYLRSHLNDGSYMRDYASHLLLNRFGLPYLRCRPALLYINGAYIGFYTVMEAPTQGYVMQRSFGAFNPERTGLFKMKSRVFDCPNTFNPFELADARDRPLPEPFYFKRGSHRNDIPQDVSPQECNVFFVSEIIRRRQDLIRGYVEYNETCGLAMVEMGRVDRDFGPKELELPMIDFLDSQVFNDTVTDLTGSVDADQWIKNFAVYAVMMNYDSPMTNINNWYLATTAGGEGDWRIVQYDHNDVATRQGANICSFQCSSRQIYWPILRPNCGPIEDHPLVGRILNDEGKIEKYLSYVQEYIEIVQTSFDDLRIYGQGIKDFVRSDPLYGVVGDGSLLEFSDTYEDRELGPDFTDYNTAETPFLKILEARILEVQSQLDAIQANALPRGGSYGKYEVCPDWRDTNGDDYLLFNSFVEGPGCFTQCSPSTICFNHDEAVCTSDGELVGDCAQASLCLPCFPFSRCGLNQLEESTSGDYIESEECTDSSCQEYSRCFDHKSGACAFDGEIIDEECREAELRCKPCFPESRCAVISPTPAPSNMPETPMVDTTTGSVEDTSSAHFLGSFATVMTALLMCLLVG